MWKPHLLCQKKLVPLNSRNTQVYERPACPSTRYLLWSHPKTPNQDWSGAVVYAAKQNTGAGSPRPCHNFHAGVEQDRDTNNWLHVWSRLMATQLAWKACSRNNSKSLLKETKQTLVQIKPVRFKAIPVSSRWPAWADTDCHSLCGPTLRGQGGTDCSEQPGGLWEQGRWHCRAAPSSATEHMPAGTSQRTPYAFSNSASAKNQVEGA